MSSRVRPVAGASALRRLRGGARGFTMIEMLVVTVMIAILVSLGLPLMNRQMRDRRCVAAAMMVHDFYRLARARALGRGGATWVSWNSAAGGQRAIYNGVASGGVLEIREAIQGGTFVSLPSTSCLATDWTGAATTNTSRHVAGFDVGQSDVYSLTQVSFFDSTTPTAVGRPYVEICFSPRGRTFVRYANSGAFTPTTGAPHFAVVNAETLINRTVWIPPNGAARIAL